MKIEWALSIVLRHGGHYLVNSMQSPGIQAILNVLARTGIMTITPRCESHLSMCLIPFGFRTTGVSSHASASVSSGYTGVTYKPYGYPVIGLSLGRLTVHGTLKPLY